MEVMRDINQMETAQAVNLLQEGQMFHHVANALQLYFNYSPLVGTILRHWAIHTKGRARSGVDNNHKSRPLYVGTILQSESSQIIFQQQQEYRF